MKPYRKYSELKVHVFVVLREESGMELDIKALDPALILWTPPSEDLVFQNNMDILQDSHWLFVGK